jgi:hypothetical protein
MSQAQSVTADFEPGYALDLTIACTDNSFIQQGCANVFVTVTNSAGTACTTYLAPLSTDIGGSPFICDNGFPDGTTVTLTATAPSAILGSGQNDFSFAWSGACSGSGDTCTLTMNADQTATATYTYQ